MVQPGYRVTYTLFTLYVAKIATAALSLGELQPITGFASQCQAAYNAPISACPDAASFMDAGSTAGCDKTCFVALNDASVAIQQACQSAAAYGDTLISHAFKGDLSIFLCGSQFSDGSNSVTATNVGISHTIPITKSRPTISLSSSTVQSSVYPTAKGTSSSDTSSTASETSSSSSSVSITSSSSSSSSSGSSSSTPDSTSPSTSSVQQTTITTVSRSSSPSSTTTSPKTSSTTFDSTPFDLPSNSGVTIEPRITNLLSLASSLVIILTWLVTS